MEEKVGVESDGEMGRRPWREPEPERSMAVAASTEVRSRVLPGLGFGRHRPDRKKTATGWEWSRTARRRSEVGRSEGRREWGIL